MAAKKTRKGGMSTGRKWLKRGVSWGFKGLGITVALSPTFRGLGNLQRYMASGTPQNTLYDIEYDLGVPYTGSDGVIRWDNSGKLFNTAGTFVVAVVLFKVGSWLARMI